MSLDLSVLSPEQKKALRLLLEAEEKEQQTKHQQEKEVYEGLKEDSVTDLFRFLFRLSNLIKSGKAKVFNTCEPLLALKKELYGLTDADLSKQQSHTFTNRANTQSVIIGYNMTDGWDDDLTTAATARIDKWLTSKVNKENEMFVSMVRDLLNATSGEGKLKASRVLELAAKAKEFGDRELIAALDVMQQAYRPAKSSTYVKAKYKDDKKVWRWVELSMSMA